MLTRDNFKDTIKSLSDEQKHNILNDPKGYVYIRISGYGDLTVSTTDDNDGAILSSIQGDDWNGNTYLVRYEEVDDILKEEISK